MRDQRSTPPCGDPLDLARLLTELRTRRGLSQAAAALAADMQTQTVRRLEQRGEDMLVSTLTRYLSGLGCTVEIAISDAATGVLEGRVVLG